MQCYSQISTCRIHWIGSWCPTEGSKHRWSTVQYEQKNNVRLYIQVIRTISWWNQQTAVILEQSANTPFQSKQQKINLKKITRAASFFLLISWNLYFYNLLPNFGLEIRIIIVSRNCLPRTNKKRFWKVKILLRVILKHDILYTCTIIIIPYSVWITRSRSVLFTHKMSVLYLICTQ